MILPIIMAGGTGSRLWPLSRELYPKQFQKLYGDNTMIQATVQRLNGLACSLPLVISNENHRFIVAEQLRQIGKLDHNIILEPVGKNTAPAVALSALYALQNQEDPILLILSADHVIKDIDNFHYAVERAIEYAKQNKLVTFGIVPQSAETGYGYIKCGARSDDNIGFEVSEFVEKPDVDTARAYLESGEYLWNSGMFAFKAKRFLVELEKYRPDIYQVCKKAIEKNQKDLDFIRIDSQVFNNCPAESIDYAVMEKTSDAVVIPMDSGWSDVGAWSSLWQISEKDEFGNVSHGDVLVHDSTDNYIFAESGLVAVAGLENTIVVQTKDAVLVADKEQAQQVKDIVKELQKLKRSEYQLHREVYRPWGKYDSIDNGNRYQVKRITVKPGEKLSVQMHHHRAEHWIIVSGTAKVVVANVESLLTENESIYIPLGAIHSLENPGKVDLELIEVQVGSYLGEDDIVRFEDRYGRN